MCADFTGTLLVVIVYIKTDKKTEYSENRHRQKNNIVNIPMEKFDPLGPNMTTKTSAKHQVNYFTCLTLESPIQGQ